MQHKETQADRLLKMLREGPATAMKIWVDGGIYRASDAVFTLRQKGYEIRTELVDFTTSRGYDVQFARYSLVSEPVAKQVHRSAGEAMELAGAV